MKYPLTASTKNASIDIVSQWEAGDLEQELKITVLDLDDKTVPGFVFGARGFTSLPFAFAVWRELEKFGLVDIRLNHNSWDILLLQELINAVKSDFEVSDYFITMNAVGNIIINSTTGPVQGVGYNTGSVHQNVEQLADYMTATLGADFLATEAALAEAISGLRSAIEADQQHKLGKVVSELGNCLQHGANAAAIVAALSAAAPFLQRVFGG